MQTNKLSFDLGTSVHHRVLVFKCVASGKQNGILDDLFEFKPLMQARASFRDFNG